MGHGNPRTFEEFWPLYLGDHRHSGSRRLHFFGTLIGFGFLLLAALMEQPWFILCAAVSGYAPAWVGHFFLEKNRPATFQHPLWSLRGDFRMFHLTLNRKLDAELQRVGLDPHFPPTPNESNASL